MNDNCVVDVEFACLKCIYMGIFGVFTKLIKNDVVVVKLWMISWLIIVVVVMGRIGDVNWVVVESFGKTLFDCWIMLKWCFDFKFWVTLSVEMLDYVEMLVLIVEVVWTYALMSIESYVHAL